MIYRWVIHQTLPGLNDFLNKTRANKFWAAESKKLLEQDMIAEMPLIMKDKKLNIPIHITYQWFEKDRRRDKDNIAFGKKFVQDALIKNGNLENDGWKEIAGFYDEFYVDKENPRVEVIIREREEEEN